MINRQMIVITETRTDLDDAWFEEAYFAAGRGSEDPTADVPLIYGLNAEITAVSDWWFADENSTEHRDCESTLFCTKQAMNIFDSNPMQKILTHKMSEDYPLTIDEQSALYVERMAHNAERNITVEVAVYPCDEHWTIDWDNPIS